MFAYNHEPYLAQALDSTLMQRTDFDYEVVVGEDCSQDNTRSILTDYQRRYPDRVRPLLHQKRLGVGANVYEVLTACRGEYVALLDGDDYWTSPDKLRKQIEFLDSHPEYTLCCHPVSMYAEDAAEFTGIWGENPQSLRTWTLQDFLTGRYWPRTSSIVYRADSFSVPQWLKQVINCDFVLITLSGDRGPFADLGPDAMSVYRVHGRGVWSPTDSVFQATETVNTRRLLNEHFNLKYASQLKVRVQMIELARAYLQAGDASAARRTFLRATLARRQGALGRKVWAAGFVAVFLPFIAKPIMSGTRSRPNSR
jgi:glycosyltransferase involved in cell wall biosynthesis